MYEVLMKYINIDDNNSMFTFKCENFSVKSDGYKFKNILMDDFIISDIEVNNEDIALIKIR